MSAEAATDPPAAEPQPARRRRRLPMALIVLATLLAFVTVFAVWANRQLLNTDNWTDTSTELLENEDIREQLSLFLVDELFSNVDIQARIEEALPPRLDPLAPTATGALRNLAERSVPNLLGRPRPQQLWEEANRRAHRRLIAVVEGDGGDNVSTEGGHVTLDLKGLLGATEERVGVGGRVAEALPADAAQITILKSDELGLAQDLLDAFQALVVVLVLLTLGLYALAVYLARGWRREALRAVGVGFFIAGAGALVVRSLAGDAVVSSLADNESVEPAVQATWTIGTSLLQEAAGAMVAYGVVFFLGAWLAGPTVWATAVRRGLAPYLREPSYAYGALALIALLLLAWGPTPSLRRPLSALLLIGLLALGLEILRRQAAREFPDASIEESTQRMRARFSSLGGRRGGGAGSSAEDRLAELERLGKLRDAGVLDGAEFEREKARIMGQAPAGAG